MDDICMKYRVYGQGFYLATYEAMDEDDAIAMAVNDWPEYCKDRMEAIAIGEGWKQANRRYPL